MVSTKNVIDALATPSSTAPKGNRAGLADTQALRLELICRIREAIASGAYDSEERLQVALDRLLDEMM